MSKFITIKNCIFNADKIVCIERTDVESEFQIFRIVVRLDDSLEYEFKCDDSNEMLNIITEVLVKLG